MQPLRLRVLLAFCCSFWMTGVAAKAQDLFELEVFDYEMTPPGGYELGLHTNVLSRDGVVSESIVGNHRPAHISVEMARGWTERFETAFFICYCIRDNCPRATPPGFAGVCTLK